MGVLMRGGKVVMRDGNVVMSSDPSSCECCEDIIDCGPPLCIGRTVPPEITLTIAGGEFADNPLFSPAWDCDAFDKVFPMTLTSVQSRQYQYSYSEVDDVLSSFNGFLTCFRDWTQLQDRVTVNTDTPGGVDANVCYTAQAGIVWTPSDDNLNNAGTISFRANILAVNVQNGACLPPAEINVFMAMPFVATIDANGISTFDDELNLWLLDPCELQVSLSPEPSSVFGQLRVVNRCDMSRAGVTALLEI